MRANVAGYSDIGAHDTPSTLGTRNTESEGGGCIVRANIAVTGDVDTMTMSIEVDYAPIVGLLPTPALLRGDFTMMMQQQSES